MIYKKKTSVVPNADSKQQQTTACMKLVAAVLLEPIKVCLNLTCFLESTLPCYGGCLRPSCTVMIAKGTYGNDSHEVTQVLSIALSTSCTFVRT